MFTVRIEHSVRDYDAWKQVFDSDPVDRRGSGVRRYRVSRSVADPNSVLIDLDLDDLASAETMLAKLKDLWAGPAAGTTVNPRGTVVEQVDSVDL